MSKHKFLFKHPNFYKNSTSGQFKTWMNLQLDVVKSGEQSEQVELITSASKTSVDPSRSYKLSECSRVEPEYSAPWNDQYGLTFKGTPENVSVIDPANPALTYSDQCTDVDGDHGGHINAVTSPAATLDNLNPPVVIPDPEPAGSVNCSFVNNNSEDLNCLPGNAFLQMLAEQHPWNGQGDQQEGDTSIKSSCRLEDSSASLESRDFYSQCEQSCNLNSDADVYSCNFNSSAEQIQPPIEPSCEQLNTEDVMNSKNRVGVITKAPSRVFKSQEREDEAHVDNTGVNRKTTTNVIIHKSEDGIKYECKVCGKKFRSKNNCKYHIHGDGKSGFPYTCEHCGKGMYASTHYRYHLRTHSGERPFKCSTCSKGFFTLAKLGRHALIHNTLKLEKCDQCPKAFHLQSQLRRHQMTHTGEQPFSCQFCKKKFSVPSELKSHEESHTGQHKYGCETCGKRFQRLKHLQNHNLIHIDAKPFPCEKCHKCFRTLASHAHHMKTHNGERPHRCPICGRTFILQKDFSRHQNIHTGVASFSCTQCEKTFRRKDNLIRHNKIYHLEDKNNRCDLQGSVTRNLSLT